ncbi:MAG: hypothetical protein ACJ72Q_21460 [Nitrososphaeraceae archaeon]|jgi:hypothetical protein
MILQIQHIFLYLNRIIREIGIIMIGKLKLSPDNKKKLLLRLPGQAAPGLSE